MEEKLNHGFRVRPFRRDDTPGVRRVLEASYGQKATPAEIYEWWSLGCPCAHPGFMVAESNGLIVGVQPMEIFQYRDAQASFKGGMLTGVAVHPDFRRRGIFSALVRACEEEAWRQGAAFVGTMPNDRSRPGFLKLGYTDLGRRTLLVRLVKPRGGQARSVPVAGNALGTVAEWIQSRFKPLAAEPGMIVRSVNGVIPEMSELAAKHASLFPGLRIQRTSEWWRWRFFEAPVRAYRILECRDHNGELAGLAVYTIKFKGRYKVSYLVDVLVSSEGAAGALVKRWCDDAAGEGAQAVGTVVGSISLTKVLVRGGLWSVPQWLPVKRFYSVVRFNPTSDVPSAWHRLSGWYQTFGDWDNL